MKNLLKNEAFYLVIIILFSGALFVLLSCCHLVEKPSEAHCPQPAVSEIVPVIDTAILNNMDSNRLNELRKQLKVGMEAKVNKNKIGAEISGRKSK